KKTVDAAAICGGADKVMRTETQQTFVNGLLGFVTLGIYTPLEARVYCSN
ncbi:lipoprotein bor, partial [Salmonella enterica subsp. houtenae]|nr:lipoprotein bor [Salmonella enterica subsp. houtenae]